MRDLITYIFSPFMMLFVNFSFSKLMLNKALFFIYLSGIILFVTSAMIEIEASKQLFTYTYEIYHYAPVLALESLKAYGTFLNYANKEYIVSKGLQVALVSVLFLISAMASFYVISNSLTSVDRTKAVQVKSANIKNTYLIDFLDLNKTKKFIAESYIEDKERIIASIEVFNNKRQQAMNNIVNGIGVGPDTHAFDKYYLRDTERLKNLEQTYKEEINNVNREIRHLDKTKNERLHDLSISLFEVEEIGNKNLRLFHKLLSMLFNKKIDNEKNDELKNVISIYTLASIISFIIGLAIELGIYSVFTKIGKHQVIIRGKN